MVTRTVSLKSRGFTLIELLVSIAIIMIILSIVVFNHQKFNDSLRLTNLAYQVALSVRQAQSYGINVRGFGTGASQIFDVGYGVHFNLSTPASYITFVDKNNNKTYDAGDGTPIQAGGTDERISNVTLENGFTIYDLCAIPIGGGSASCAAAGSFQTMDISFYRYTPDASFKFTGGTPSAQGVSIQILSPQGLQKQIEVGLTGQISITNVP